MNLKNNFKDILCDKTILESTLIALSETWLGEEENHLIDGYKSHFNSVGPGKSIEVYFKIFKHVIDVKKEKMQLSNLESSTMDVIAVYRSEQSNTMELLDHIFDLIPLERNTVICRDFNICYMSQRNNRIDYWAEMGQEGTWIDSVFVQVTSWYIGLDIKILTTSAASKTPFIRLAGSINISTASSHGPPLLIGNYSNVHYQSLQ